MVPTRRTIAGPIPGRPHGQGGSAGAPQASITTRSSHGQITIAGSPPSQWIHGEQVPEPGLAIRDQPRGVEHGPDRIEGRHDGDPGIEGLAVRRPGPEMLGLGDVPMSPQYPDQVVCRAGGPQARLDSRVPLRPDVRERQRRGSRSGHRSTGTRSDSRAPPPILGWVSARRAWKRCGPSGRSACSSIPRGTARRARRRGLHPQARSRSRALSSSSR